MKVEEALRNNLDNETLNDALSFVDYLEAKGLRPVFEQDNKVRFSKNDKYPCMIMFGKNDDNIGEWYISDLPVVSELEWEFINRDYKDFMVKYIKICSVHEGGSCSCGNEPGQSIDIFGKTYKNVCKSIIQFANPDNDITSKLKSIINWWSINVL